jgi:hypothetical protein
MDTQKLVHSHETDLLASLMPNILTDELMEMLLLSPSPSPHPTLPIASEANVVLSDSVTAMVTKPTEETKKRVPWNKGRRKSSKLTTRAKNPSSQKKRRKQSNVATSSTVIEPPPTTIIEGAEGNEVVKASPPQPPPIMAMTNVQVEMQIDLFEAQRLSDVTVQEWFAKHRATMHGTLVEEVDKRLVMMLARKKLADSQQALVKACVADAVAHAIFITLFT